MGMMPFMLPNQQRQSAEGYIGYIVIYFHHYFGSFSSFSSVSSVIHHTFALPLPSQIADVFCLGIFFGLRNLTILKSFLCLFFFAFCLSFYGSHWL